MARENQHNLARGDTGDTLALLRAGCGGGETW